MTRANRVRPGGKSEMWREGVCAMACRFFHNVDMGKPVPGDVQIQKTLKWWRSWSMPAVSSAVQNRW